MSTSVAPAPSSKFRYTPGTDEKTSAAGKLNAKQRKFYDRNGFIVIPKLVPDDLLDECRQRFLDIIDGKVEKGGILVMKDVSLKDRTGVTNERLVNKIQDICYDDVLFSYFSHPAVLDYAENFTGPNLTAMHTMLINKPPDSGKLTSRHPCHQDLYYFPFRPADRIVAAWTAMEKIDGENGCLFAYPGSHRPGELYRHDYPEWEDGVNKMYHGVRGTDPADRVELHMEKGDTVFFHPLLIHGSGPNRTSRFRKAISCHYASSDCHYVDVRGTVQESIANEIDEIVKQKGLNITFQDVWQLRCRKVRGDDGQIN